MVKKVRTQKHFGLKLNHQLNFREHLNDKFLIVNNTRIGMLKKLNDFLPRHLQELSQNELICRQY